MSRIAIVGHAVRDAEYTAANGDRKQYAKFTIAEDNEYGDLSSFYDAVVFGKYADSVYKNMYKGRLVAVYGRFEQGETYTDKSGNKRRSWTLYPEKIKYLDKRREEPEQPAFEEVEEETPF